MLHGALCLVRTTEVGVWPLYEIKYLSKCIYDTHEKLIFGQLNRQLCYKTFTVANGNKVSRVIKYAFNIEVYNAEVIGEREG